MLGFRSSWLEEDLHGRLCLLLLLLWLVLNFQPREERFHAVVVRLAPLLERMVMASRTLNSLAEKQLGHIFQLRRWIAGRSIPDNRRNLADFATCGEDVADDVAVGTVFADAVPKPVEEGLCRLLRLLLVVAAIPK